MPMMSSHGKNVFKRSGMQLVKCKTKLPNFQLSISHRSHKVDPNAWRNLSKEQQGLAVLSVQRPLLEIGRKSILMIKKFPVFTQIRCFSVQYPFSGVCF